MFCHGVLAVLVLLPLPLWKGKSLTNYNFSVDLDPESGQILIPQAVRYNLKKIDLFHSFPRYILILDVPVTDLIKKKVLSVRSTNISF